MTKKIKVRKDSLDFKGGFEVVFERTLRIPDDDETYPLPPGLGAFPICKVEDYADRVPQSWRDRGGAFFPMYQCEAMWMMFGGYKPRAVKVAIGKINAITGKRMHDGLNKTAQNYVVAPNQPWLDGIKAGEGFIRQFVAMPLGMGYTVEGQVTGKEEFGGIQITVYKPKPGAIIEGVAYMKCDGPMAAPAEMGLGAGGKMEQNIYPDSYGWDVWDQDNPQSIYVHIANSMMYRDITGLEPPGTPVSAELYTQYGFPWFKLYDEGKQDLKPSETLKKVKSIKEMDKKKGFGAQQDDSSVDIPNGQVKKLKTD